MVRGGRVVIKQDNRFRRSRSRNEPRTQPIRIGWETNPTWGPPIGTVVITILLQINNKTKKNKSWAVLCRWDPWVILSNWRGTRIWGPVELVGIHSWRLGWCRRQSPRRARGRCKGAVGRWTNQTGLCGSSQGRRPLHGAPTILRAGRWLAAVPSSATCRGSWTTACLFEILSPVNEQSVTSNQLYGSRFTSLVGFTLWRHWSGSCSDVIVQVCMVTSLVGFTRWRH